MKVLGGVFGKQNVFSFIATTSSAYNLKFSERFTKLGGTKLLPLKPNITQGIFQI